MATVADTLLFNIDANDKASRKLLKVTAQLGAVGLAVGKFGKASIDAYKDAETQQAKLQLAYKKFPALADENIDSLRGLNSELAKKTKYDDDATASAEASLAQFKLTGKQIKSLIPLVQDYASATGKDLNTAATDVGKALLGQGRALKAVGVNYKATGNLAADLTTLQDALNQKVGGFAENEGKTAAGQAAILRNQYGELQETVGAALVPAMNTLVGVGLKVLDFFNSLPEPVKQATVLIGGLGGAALYAAPKLVAMRDLLGAGGVAKTAGEGASGLSKFAGIIGKAGPWGLAVAGAIGLVSVFTEGTRSEIRAIEDSTAALGESEKAYLAHVSAKNFASFATAENLKLLRDSGISLELVKRALDGDVTAYGALNAQLQKQIDGQQLFQETMTGGAFGTVPILTETGQRLKDLQGDLSANNEALAASAEYWRLANQAAGQYSATVSGIPRLAVDKAAVSKKLNVKGFAEGGVVPATPGGQLIRVAEGGHDEAIVPLSGPNAPRAQSQATTVLVPIYIDGVEYMRKAIRVRGGNVQAVLGS